MSKEEFAVTSRSVIYRLMEAQKNFSESIFELQKNQTQTINELMEKVNDAILRRTDAMGYSGFADLFIGVASGVAGIASGFTADSLSKILETVSRVLPQMPVKTFMQIPIVKAEAEQNLLINVKLNRAYEKTESQNRAIKDSNDRLMQMMQTEERAKSEIGRLGL